MQSLYDLGKIRQIGIMYVNGDECPIYAHQKSGDIFVHVLSEDASTLISELTLTDDIVDVADATSDYNKAIVDAAHGAIGAIRHGDGSFTIISEQDGTLTAQHNTDVIEIDMSMDVYPEDYED